MPSRRPGRRPGLWGVELRASLLALLAGGAFAEPDDRSEVSDRDFATALIARHQAEIELAHLHRDRTDRASESS